jgi:uncharacterized protein (TIGR02217 family)
MALNNFPVLPGLGWSVTKTPAFKTRVQKSVSGRERRALDQPLPIWTWTLTYDFLRDQAAQGYNELRALMGFHAQQQGAFVPFLYTDPTDNSVTGQYLGTGNASQTQFQLVRNLDAALPGAGYAEPITNPTAVAAVYLNGVRQTPGTNTYNDMTGILTFATAPPSGAVITADFTYAFQVRFSDDTASFENFMLNLWRLKQVKLVSVLL